MGLRTGFAHQGLQHLTVIVQGYQDVIERDDGMAGKVQDAFLIDVPLGNKPDAQRQDERKERNRYTDDNAFSAIVLMIVCAVCMNGRPIRCQPQKPEATEKV
ncbi:Uncharacterised protein [Enterobacter cancerogenus]|uniref:Uncharacterized protein n=1 Tax=Enterobacter cancerogenus TaxID=69218 RepID=A0A484W6M4_9ENTR|nr:Uncharacterised protein [Enterobacter cancerogenus]